MTRLFVTGTGTGVGKTFVTAALIHAARRAGRPVNALKPVLSGFDPACPQESDAGVLLTALGLLASIENLDRIAPWRFPAPLSPDMAAAREGRAIDFAALVAHGRAAAGDPLLIEGVGGCMVPLDERHTVLDWITALSMPVILVAGSYLGTISHTLSSLAALKPVALVRAVVVSESTDQPVPLEETVVAIARFTAGVPVVPVRRRTDWRDVGEVAELF